MHARRAAALYISLRCSPVSVLAQQHRSMPHCRIVYRNVCMHMSAAASVECSSAVQRILVQGQKTAGRCTAKCTLWMYGVHAFCCW